MLVPACYRPRMGIHWQELIVILLIVLVLFGPKRLPEIGSSLGKGIRGFRDGMSGKMTETVDADAPQATIAAATAAPVAVPVAVEVVDPAERAGSDAAR